MRDLACVSLLLAAGCTGSFGSTGGGGGGGGPPPASESECVAEAGRTAVPLQRLNAAQFAQVVRELWDGQVDVPPDFPAALTGYPYTTYGAANPMGEGEAEAVLGAAEAVALQVADLVPRCSGDETTCATGYLEDLATRAFRRPVAAEE